MLIIIFNINLKLFRSIKNKCNFILESEYGEPNKTLIIGLNWVVFDGTPHFFGGIRRNTEECGNPQFRLSVFDKKIAIFLITTNDRLNHSLLAKCINNPFRPTRVTKKSASTKPNIYLAWQCIRIEWIKTKRKSIE